MVEPKKAKVPVTIRIDPEMLILLKQEAEKRGETVSNYIRSSAVMRINGELVPAGKDDTRMRIFVLAVLGDYIGLSQV